MGLAQHLPGDRALGLLAIFLIVTRLKGEWAEARGERFDVVGAVIYGLALVALTYGLSILPSAIGALLAVAAWRVSPFSPGGSYAPTIPCSTFAPVPRQPGLRPLQPGRADQLRRHRRGHVPAQPLPPVRAGAERGRPGLVLVSQPVVMMLVSLVAGRLADRIEPAHRRLVRHGAHRRGLLAFYWLSTDTSLAFVVAMLVVQGIGFGIFSSPNATAVMNSCAPLLRRRPRHPEHHAGHRALVGMALTMVVLSLYIGQAPVSADNLPAFLAAVQIACLLFAVLSVGGVIASLVRGKVHDPEPAPARGRLELVSIGAPA